MIPSAAMDALWIKALVRALVLPPTGPLLVALAGVALWRRHPRTGRALAALGVVVLLALATPAVGVLLLRTLDIAPPLDLARAHGAQAIVVLGGGIRPGAAEYGGDTLGRLTLERVRYGARVARATGLPVLVTGGMRRSGPSEAALMRRALEDEFGVRVRWVEEGSRNTHENARLSAALLGPEGVRKVVLVAHSMDLPRAAAEFAAAGLEVVPAPTLIPVPQIDSFLDFVPSLGGLTASHYALYEWLALAVLAVAPK